MLYKIEGINWLKFAEGLWFVLSTLGLDFKNKEANHTPQIGISAEKILANAGKELSN